MITKNFSSFFSFIIIFHYFGHRVWRKSDTIFILPFAAFKILFSIEIKANKDSKCEAVICKGAEKYKKLRILMVSYVYKGRKDGEGKRGCKAE